MEIYATGRYFTVTGQHVKGTPTEVQKRPRTLAKVVRRLSQSGSKPLKQIRDTSGPRQSSSAKEKKTALAALAVLSADAHYDDWIRIGMALHAVDSSQKMCRRFDKWSSHSEKYRDGEPQAKWASFRGQGGIGIGTLCELADATGKDWRSTIDREADNADDKRDKVNRYAAIISVGQFIKRYPNLREVVVDGLIRRGETCNLIAKSKVGKSWLIYQLAFSVAHGRKWLERFETKRGRVLLIDNELHRQSLAVRMKQTTESLGISINASDTWLDVLALRGYATDIATLERRLSKLERGVYSMIIIDAFYRVLPEKVSENDNAQMMAIYNTIDRIAKKTRAAIVLVHHTTKGGQGDKDVTDVGSGAGAISRAADTHLILRQHQVDNAAVLDAALRSFPRLEPVGLSWTPPLWNVDDTLDVNAVRGRKQSATPRAKQERILEMLRAVGETGATKSKIKERTGISRDLDKELQSLIEAGEIVRSKVRIASNRKQYDGWRIADSKLSEMKVGRRSKSGGRR